MILSEGWDAGVRQFGGDLQHAVRTPVIYARVEITYPFTWWNPVTTAVLWWKYPPGSNIVLRCRARSPSAQFPTWRVTFHVWLPGPASVSGAWERVAECDLFPEDRGTDVWLTKLRECVVEAERAIAGLLAG